MRKFILALCTFFVATNVGAIEKSTESNYPNNRWPLKPKNYIELPVGAIKAKGWLQEMLERQRSGSTGHMDEIFPLVMGKRNGWLGGDGDQWERGPYWIDGLLQLAYLLDDNSLKEKAKPWVEWILSSQQESGFFGPAKDYPGEPNIVRDLAQDWWPRIVVLKILMQHYDATKDQRVIPFMTRYFKYQLQTLPENPLDKWSYWARYRACDNMAAVYWLYNITGDKFLLELGELLHKQSHDFTNMFLNTNDLQRYNTIHCVNLAQGIKEPIIYYQQSGEQKYLDAVKKGFADLKFYNGQAQGMYGADEGLHGNNPTQGVELCSIIEMMYSLEKLVEISGDLAYMEHLEKIAFNALPTQVTDDFMYKQYFQQANQVMCTHHSHRNFYEDNYHGGTDLIFGTLSGYPCCFSNMHQGWPRFTRNLWYATPDNGIAALIFSPSEVTAKVGNGILVNITEDTFYPMDDRINFTLDIKTKKIKEVEFPFYLRIPAWCKGATIAINGKMYKSDVEGGRIEIINRNWKSGDTVELKMPMDVKVEDTWYDKSMSVERGPLVYALKIEEEWNKKEFAGDEAKRFGEVYWEVTPKTAWNYGIVEFDKKKIDESFKVDIDREKMKSNYPWNLQNAPIEIKVKAKKIPYWTLYNEMAGPLPFSVGSTDQPAEEVVLVPYGCTTLRISQFPVMWK